MTQEQTDQIYDAITANDCREMDRERFHQAANEAIEIFREEKIKELHLILDNKYRSPLIRGFNVGVKWAIKLIKEK